MTLARPVPVARPMVLPPVVPKIASSPITDVAVFEETSPPPPPPVIIVADPSPLLVTLPLLNLRVLNVPLGAPSISVIVMEVPPPPPPDIEIWARPVSPSRTRIASKSNSFHQRCIVTFPGTGIQAQAVVSEVPQAPVRPSQLAPAARPPPAPLHHSGTGCL